MSCNSLSTEAGMLLSGTRVLLIHVHARDDIHIYQYATVQQAGVYFIADHVQLYKTIVAFWPRRVPAFTAPGHTAARPPFVPARSAPPVPELPPLLGDAADRAAATRVGLTTRAGDAGDAAGATGAPPSVAARSSEAYRSTSSEAPSRAPAPAATSKSPPCCSSSPAAPGWG